MKYQSIKIQTNKQSHGFCFVFTNCSWAWNMSWGVVDICTVSPSEKHIFPLPVGINYKQLPGVFFGVGHYIHYSSLYQDVFCLKVFQDLCILSQFWALILEPYELLYIYIIVSVWFYLDQHVYLEMSTTLVITICLSLLHISLSLERTCVMKILHFRQSDPKSITLCPVVGMCLNYICYKNKVLFGQLNDAMNYEYNNMFLILCLFSREIIVFLGLMNCLVSTGSWPLQQYHIRII